MRLLRWLWGDAEGWAVTAFCLMSGAFGGALHGERASSWVFAGAATFCMVIFVVRLLIRDAT